MSDTKRIKTGLSAALGLFVSIPLTAIPAMAQTPGARVDRTGLRPPGTSTPTKDDRSNSLVERTETGIRVKTPSGIRVKTVTGIRVKN